MANVSKKAADSAVFIPNYDRTSARSASRNVWLKFDDGPQPSYTDTILKTLERHKIKATFFVLGRNAKARVQIVRAAFQAGHRIGNHSYTHRDCLTSAPTGQTEAVEEERVLGSS